MVTKKPNVDKKLPPIDPGQVSPGLETIRDTLGEFLDTASVDRVYGEPLREGDLTVIPTAEVVVGLGFGVGFGGGQGPVDDDEAEPDKGGETTAGGFGGGGGGGGRTLSRPVAIVVVSPDGVLVEPVVDVTKIAIASITAAGFMMATLMGILSPKRMVRQLKGE